MDADIETRQREDQTVKTYWYVNGYLLPNNPSKIDLAIIKGIVKGTGLLIKVSSTYSVKDKT